ncbi:MAG: HNH endonuclease [Halanaeroarchaeum sp.]
MIPVRKFIESDRHAKEEAHFIENVVTLCPSCHRKAEFGTISKPRLRYLIGKRGSERKKSV